MRPLKFLGTSPVLVLILAIILFASSGRLNWMMAWLFIALVIIQQCLIAITLSRINPELMAACETKGWDKLLYPLIGLYIPPATWIVAGLDFRFGWSLQIPVGLQIVMLVVGMTGILLTHWAMASNKFYSGVVCIQKDRGHTVAATGPYRLIRHPGYLGGIMFYLSTPLVLGSLFALIPALLPVSLIIVRTALEDKTLHEELDGYRDYAKKVRHRLFPGVW